MCISPGLLKTGQLIGCRECWQCREHKINDWVGRNIAENKTASSSNFVTLTYGHDMTYGSVDHERAAILTYSDVQKFFKRLRKAGHNCRYFCVGEYGSLKGRAHWHILIYWLGKAPQFNLDTRESSKFWDHGFVRWEQLNSSSIRYACKYLQKDMGKLARQAHLAMSKKPPLGHEFFQRRAQQHVDQFLAPQDLLYSWPDVVDKQGRPIKFHMHGVTATNFLQAYIDRWKATHGDLHDPHSDLVEAYRDGLITDDLEFTINEKRYAKLKAPWLPAPENKTPLFSAPHNSYYVESDGQKWFWTFDDEGNRSWQVRIKSESEGENAVSEIISRNLG